MESDNNDLEDKKWNSHQDKGNVNEGFSGENIDSDYNPSDESISDRLKAERETDELGNDHTVDRARYPDDSEFITSGDADNSAIRNKESLENRDRNYDTSENRYPPSHPDTRENRGNIEMDEP